MALVSSYLKLVLCLPKLRLVGVVRLHGRVKLVEYLKDLLVNLVADLTALKKGPLLSLLKVPTGEIPYYLFEYPLEVVADDSAPVHHLARVDVGKGRVVPRRLPRLLHQLLPQVHGGEEGPAIAPLPLLLVPVAQVLCQLVQLPAVGGLDLGPPFEHVLELGDQRELCVQPSVQAF